MSYKAIINIDVQAKSLEQFWKKLRSESNSAIRMLGKQEAQLKKTFGERMQMRMKKFTRGIRAVSTETRYLRFAAAAGMGFAIKTAMGFEEQMFRAGFILRSNNKELAEMKTHARDLAKGTIFSPTEIGTAEKELAKAGISQKEIMDQIGTFAKFAQLTEAPLVDMTRDTAAAFKLLGKEGQTAAEFMNILSGSMMSSRLTGVGMMEAIKFSGSELQHYEGDITDVAAVLGALAEGMQDGSRAGTGLRAMFKRLANPVGQATSILAKWSSESGISRDEIMSQEGYIKNFGKLFDMIKLGKADAKEIDIVFGKIAGTSASTLLGRDGDTTLFHEQLAKQKALLDDFRSEGKTINEAFDIGIKDTAFGKWKAFIAQLEDLAIQLGESGLLGAFKSVLDMATPMFQWFAGLSDGMKSTAIFSSMAATGLLALLPAIGGLTALLSTGGGVAVMGFLGAEIGVLLAGLASIPVVAGLAAIALAAMYGDMDTWWNSLKGFTKEMDVIFVTGTWEESFNSIGYAFLDLVTIFTAGAWDIKQAVLDMEMANATIADFEENGVDQRNRSLMYMEARKQIIQMPLEQQREAMITLRTIHESDNGNNVVQQQMKTAFGKNIELNHRTGDQ